MNFLESPRFPDAISLNSLRSVAFNTDVVVLSSGHEQRNARWSMPLHRFEVGSGIKNRTDLSQIIHFFNTVQGRFRAFRVRDWLDYASSAVMGQLITPTDQILGVGDGNQRAFALIKTYTTGELTQTRRIHKPVENTVCVAVNGRVDTRFRVNTVNGVIELGEDDEPPQPGDVITAGFEFDVPCRFDTDSLTIGLQNQDWGSFSVPLVEVRLDL